MFGSRSISCLPRCAVIKGWPVGFRVVRAGGCLMDKDKHLLWEANDAIPTLLALVAGICLWGFVASAATIYSSTLAHEVQNKSVLLALQAKS
jgi:hypothetical protein